MKFYKSIETLDKIKSIIEKKEKGLYLRFGDGDVNLACDESELLQKTNTHLTLEMREAFSINEKNVLKTLPLYCKEYGGWEEGMFPGNHEAPKEWCDNILNKLKDIWTPEEVYSHAALHFLATTNKDASIDFLIFLKKTKPIFIVGNQNIPRNILNKIFGEQCEHICSPPNNSFDDIDRIEKECSEYIDKNNYKYNIIITSMGCSGRVLQKRLYNKYENIFIFDFGSLMDAFCGDNSRAWITLTKFDAKKFLNNLK
jgi:hypothetical protein